MIGYPKCVYANKLTLTGYVLLILSLITWKFSFPCCIMLLSLSAALLGGTIFGLDTYVAYKISKKALERDYQNLIFLNWNDYCSKAGHKLALKEAQKA